MPFVVKATYRNETRKFSFNDSHFPNYEELYHQLYRVFAIGHSYFLSKLLFSPQEGARILIGMEAHSAVEYDIHCTSFKGRIYPSGRLMFSVFDETPHKVPASRATVPGSFIHPIPPVPPTPFFAPPPPPPVLPTSFFAPPPPPPPPPQPQSQPDSLLDSPPPLRYNSFGPNWSFSGQPSKSMDIDSVFNTKQNTATSTDTECCSVAQGKKEVKAMMDDFLHDFTRIMGSTFGEDHSFFDPLGTPTIQRNPSPRGPSPLPAIDLDGSLHIPGSFTEPRPQSPGVLEDDADVEKSQTPPQLEPLQNLHPGIWCDFCGKQIRGLRFNCQECREYDLCANCIVVNQALDRHNATQPTIHRFNTISPPSRMDTRTEIISAVGPRRPVPCSPPTSVPAPVIHSGITCDLCGEVVVGNRHKCLNCPDYDLCDRCIGTAPTEHPLHRFLRLETPARVRFNTRPAPPERNPVDAQHNARCNLCDSRILGDRYKCTNCPDFDTCALCFTITREQHPFHSFVKVSRAVDFMIRAHPDPVYHFATCDGCKKNIVGVRYKCMHADCPDFDLCQDCEALPIAVHPAMHPFLKIRSGDTRIPTVQRNAPRGVSPPPVPQSPEPTPFISTPVATVTPAATPVTTQTQVQVLDVTPTTEVKAIPVLPPSPIERLHAIRAQAERRLSARMQQLQSYPFAEGSANPAVDPIIEERLMRERKEAEEKSRMMDQEIEELEKARRRKHDDALKQPSRPYLESVKAAFADTPEVYQSILKLLIDCFGTTDPALTASITHQIRGLLDGKPALLQGLEAFVTNPAESVTEPQTLAPEYPPLEDVIAPAVPEMTQRRTSFFGNPFLHPLESPLQALFVSDNNIPDGHIFPAGAEFVKSWRLENDGPEAWAEGTELVFVGGIRLGAFAGAPTTYDVGMVSVGEEVDVCAGDMKAPEVPGRYISHWRLRDPQGRQFGPRMWCDIEVLEVESDNSQHGSLASSAVVMPGTAPEQAASVNGAANLLSGPSSPVTVPSSAVTMTDDASSDASSVGSVSIVDHLDSDWDEIQDIPSPRRLSAAPTRGNVSEDVEYQVLYDSASDEA